MPLPASFGPANGLSMILLRGSEQHVLLSDLPVSPFEGVTEARHEDRRVRGRVQNPLVVVAQEVAAERLGQRRAIIGDGLRAAGRHAEGCRACRTPREATSGRGGAGE